MKKITILFAALVFCFFAIAQNDDYFVGEWEVTVEDTPQGDITLNLVVERSGDDLEGKFVEPNSGMEIPITSISEGENSITLYFFAEGYDLFLTLSKGDGDEISGYMVDTFFASGKRIK